MVCVVCVVIRTVTAAMVCVLYVVVVVVVVYMGTCFVLIDVQAQMKYYIYLLCCVHQVVSECVVQRFCE